MVSSKLIVSCVALLLALYLTPNVQASYVEYIIQSGNNVVATGSGSLNTSALSGSNGGGEINPQVWLSYPSGCCLSPPSLIAVGSGGFDSALSDFYSANPISGPDNFGSGPEIDASSGIGNTVVLVADAFIGVPFGYISGSDLG